MVIWSYSNVIMEISQQVKKGEIFCRASARGRVVAGLVFVGVVVVFVLVRLASARVIDIGLLVGPCGFKQRYGLPCPTCGWTSSAEAFASGDFAAAYYMQPAAALLCSILAIAAFFAFFQAVFGLYSVVLKSVYAKVKLGYILAALAIIAGAGWAVTLARALAAR
ncbi:MAG TPA: DUF2752 domain-containing protein [Sedimentisphaerales bacterium]|nr:DUF2752 domain-containing protein [Sedimentisphaerales bacterium]